MQVPIEIVQRQLCSHCQKYLSVGPIRVYHNKEVRCGRCVKDDDNGVESILFSTIAKNMLFPCTNCLEGCGVQLPMSEMKQHEQSCQETKYNCPMCEKFGGSAYALSKHCEILHRTQRLKLRAFIIDLEKGNQHEWYFYLKDDLLLFVDFEYEADLQRIVLDIILPAQKYKCGILKSVSLSSIENRTIFKAKETICSRLNSTGRSGVNIDIANLKFARNIAYCDFNIIRSFRMDKPVVVIDPMLDCFTARCEFKNISRMHWEVPQVFPAVYYFLGTQWRICLRVDNTGYLWAYLQWSMENCTNYEVVVYFTLLASHDLTKPCIKRCIQYSIDNNNYNKGNKNGVYLEVTQYILDLKRGFIQNDSITMEVNVKINPEKKKIVKCSGACIEHCKH